MKKTKTLKVIGGSEDDRVLIIQAYKKGRAEALAEVEKIINKRKLYVRILAKRKNRKVYVFFQLRNIVKKDILKELKKRRANE